MLHHTYTNIHHDSILYTRLRALKFGENGDPRIHSPSLSYPTPEPTRVLVVPALGYLTLSRNSPVKDKWKQCMKRRKKTTILPTRMVGVGWTSRLRRHLDIDLHPWDPSSTRRWAQLLPHPGTYHHTYSSHDFPALYEAQRQTLNDGYFPSLSYTLSHHNTQTLLT